VSVALKHLCIIVLSLLSIVAVQAQVPQNANKPTRGRTTAPLQEEIKADTTTSPTRTDSLTQTPSTLQAEIDYDAEDSIRLSRDQTIVRLYGNANIKYGTIELTAAFIEINYQTKVLSARGVQDSTGNEIGTPVFKDAGETFVTKNIKYNFDTKKAFISGVVTQQGEGYMIGEQVKRNAAGEAFIKKARYTTCNLETPHFHIQSDKIKLVPNDKVITGPFNLHVNNVPTPLGLPFGMFPVPKKRASGIIVPTYGEERRRGFFLRDGGYYFAISDYVDLAVTGEIYSKGSRGLAAVSNYAKRYRYKGNVNIRYNSQRLSDNEEDSLTLNDFWIRWTHTPQNTGKSRLSASVNAGSSSYNINNPSLNDLNRNIRQEWNSSVNYSTTFLKNRFNLNTSFRLNQNVRTNELDLLLPQVSLNMNRVYPFKSRTSSGKSWYEKINVAWGFDVTNQITNQIRVRNEEGQLVDSIAPFSMETLPTLLANAQNGARHSIPISTSIPFLNYITVSPTVRYNEVWYLQKLDWFYNPESQTAEADTINGFARAGEYTMSASATTRIYGTFNFGQDKAIQAIRHTLVPTISFNYRPDFSDTSRFDHYQIVQTDANGNTALRSRYQGSVFGGPGQGESRSLSFSLNNSIEMKVRSAKDTANGFTKVPLLENLAISTSYNFAADSFRLAPIGLTARTRLFNGIIDVNFTSTIDPYVYRLDTSFFNSSGTEVIRQTRVNRFAWQENMGLGDITSAQISLSTQLSPDGFGRNRAQQNLPDPNEAENPLERTILEDIAANPEDYVDFDIPWSLRLRYNLNYTGAGFEEARIRQALTFSGDISISEKWKIGFRSGYDFQRRALTQAILNVSRDLHCWQLNFNWVPFGANTSYSLDLNVKASVLQDLRLSRRRSFFDL